MKVKTKILNKEIDTPKLKYAKNGDAGIDLTATSKWYDENGNICYGTNRAFEIPKGYVGLIFPRSSNAKMTLHLTNSVGVIDSGYRGEVLFKFKPSAAIFDIKGDSNGSTHNTLVQELHEIGLPFLDEMSEYKLGDRIGQIIIMPYPQIEFEEVEELSETERGSGGYGSTGN